MKILEKVFNTITSIYAGFIATGYAGCLMMAIYFEVIENSKYFETSYCIALVYGTVIIMGRSKRYNEKMEKLSEYFFDD